MSSRAAALLPPTANVSTVEIGGSSWRERLPSIAQRGARVKFGGADATQNGQKASIVVALNVWVLNEVTAMKVRIEYCVP